MCTCIWWCICMYAIWYSMRMRIVGDDGLLLFFSLLPSLSLSLIPGQVWRFVCVVGCSQNKILGKKLAEVVHSISVIGSSSISPSPISQNSYYIHSEQAWKKGCCWVQQEMGIQAWDGSHRWVVQQIFPPIFGSLPFPPLLQMPKSNP